MLSPTPSLRHTRVKEHALTASHFRLVQTFATPSTARSPTPACRDRIVLPLLLLLDRRAPSSRHAFYDVLLRAPAPASSAALTHPPSSDTTLYSPAARAAAPRRLLRCPSPTHRAPARHLLRMPRATSHATASAACCANEASTASPHWPLPAAPSSAPSPANRLSSPSALSAISFDRPPISQPAHHEYRHRPALHPPPSYSSAFCVRQITTRDRGSYAWLPHRPCPIADAAVPAAPTSPEAGAHCGPRHHAHCRPHAQHTPRWTPAFCAPASRPVQTTHRDNPRPQEKRARPRTLISTALHLSSLSAIARAGYSHPSPIATAITVTPGPRARHVLRVHRNFQPQPAPPAPGDSRCKECALPCTLDPHSRPRVLLRYTTNLPLLGHHHPPPARAPTRILHRHLRRPPPPPHAPTTSMAASTPPRKTLRQWLLQPAPNRLRTLPLHGLQIGPLVLLQDRRQSRLKNALRGLQPPSSLRDEGAEASGVVLAS
ncbi:hypothetical protein B0H10DRAFT_2443198 [Mycena sp. CBHHK59/15]|nr:hypothetical protein B0H10DRAFT_2443198 [Mycena sp. CBHHK59/15]